MALLHEPVPVGDMSERAIVTNLVCLVHATDAVNQLTALKPSTVGSIVPSSARLPTRLSGD